jgi:hypothetical protein
MWDGLVGIYQWKWWDVSEVEKAIIPKGSQLSTEKRNLSTGMAVGKDFSLVAYPQIWGL